MMEVKNRKKVIDKYLEISAASISSIAKELNMHRKTVSRIINRHKDSVSVDEAEGSGLYRHSFDKKLHDSIKRSCRENSGLSDRDRALRYGKSRQNAQKNCVNGRYKSYIAEKRPNRTLKQDDAAKIRVRRIYNHMLKNFHG